MDCASQKEQNLMQGVELKKWFISSFTMETTSNSRQTFKKIKRILHYLHLEFFFLNWIPSLLVICDVLQIHVIFVGVCVSCIGYQLHYAKLSTKLAKFNKRNHIL